MVVLLVAGVVLSFGILTYLIDRKETAILLSYDRDRSTLIASDIMRDVKELMLVEKKPAAIRQLVTNHDVRGEIKAALFRADGTLYAGETDHRVPADILSDHRETSFRAAEHLIFFAPLMNEKACQQCHESDRKMLGVIMVDISAKKMVSVTRDLLKNMIYFTIVMAGLSSGVLIFIFRRMVFQPLAALHEGAIKISSGDYHHRVSPQSDDEFGRLASTFNKMAESIQHSQLTLERAVQKRTTELEVAARLSVEIFGGDRPLAQSIDLFLEAIIGKLGFGYASIGILDKKTGHLSQEFRKGSKGSFRLSDISLADEQPLSRVILEGEPVITDAAKIGIAEINHQHVIIIPIISHQKKKCQEVNLCHHKACPAFGNADERCWIMQGTFYRSPHSIRDNSKLLGCLRCSTFPIYGVLLAGTDDMQMLAAPTLNTLEILSAEIASAWENYLLIEQKKEDILNMVRLHDLSIQKMTTLDMPSLMNFIVSSILPFANMQAALLWVKIENELHFSGAFVAGDTSEGDYSALLKAGVIPPVIPLDGSIIGRSILERRPIETITPFEIASIGEFIIKNNFNYATSLPLVFRDEVQGCVTLFKTDDFLMTDSEKAVIELFANQASAAMHTVHLHDNLRLSEEKYRALMNEASDGIFLLDAEGNIIELNNKAVEILRYTKDAVIGRPYTSIIHKDQLQRARDLFGETLTSSGIGSMPDLLIERGDGSQVFIDVSCSIVDVSDNKVLQAIFRDTTERKRMKIALKTLNEKVYGASSELFFQSLALNMAENLGISFVVIGELTDNRQHIRTVAVCADGNIRENFEYSLAGTAGENVVGGAFCSYPENVYALFPEDKILGEISAEGYMGSSLLDSDGNPVGIIAALDRHPISDSPLNRFIFHMHAVRAAYEMKRMQSDKLLKIEKEFSEAIFDSTAGGIMVIDRQGRILKLNRAGALILGRSAEYMVGKNIVSLHPEFSKVLSDRSSFGQEVIINTGGDHMLPIGYSTSLLPGSQGRDEAIVVLFRDLSEIKKLQAELKKKAYFETMGKVVSGVAHEVRNPLFGISSIGQILERESENPQHLPLITAMLRECDRVKNLIEELLLYTRTSRLDIREIDLTLLLMELEHHLKGKRDGIAISVEIPPALAISADRDKISQVLLNILDNAIEAARTCVAVKATGTGNETEIRIKDDGLGIPQANREKVFEPFFTTKKGGTGLGLPICKKLIEDHEGSIEIISQQDEGTIVVLRLKS